MIDPNKYTGGGGDKFFKGSEITGNSMIIVPVGLREVVLPNSGDTLIMDFDFKKGVRSFPLNVTNVKKLVDITKGRLESIIGSRIKLKKVLVTNPKTKKEVESIRLEEAKPFAKTQKIAK